MQGGNKGVLLGRRVGEGGGYLRDVLLGEEAVVVSTGSGGNSGRGVLLGEAVEMVSARRRQVGQQ